MDPELKEIEEWEAAALVAIEAWDRQRDHKRRHGEEQDHDEMQKRRHVEELRQQVRQEAATKRAAADAKKK